MTRAEDPRAAYVAIATACFAANGYHGTSLAAVARAAGVTKQALLHFFGTKEKLYAATLSDLAARLSNAIEAAAKSDATAHLRAYFEAFHLETASKPDDIRLVVRALLDADETARRWPMKPYLDQLLSLIAQTPKGAQMTGAQRLAWLSEMIGMLQYLSISQTTLAGMYGAQTAGEVSAAFSQSIDVMMARLSPLQ